MTTRVSHLTSVHVYNDTRIFHKQCVSLVRAGYDVTLIAPVNDAFQEKGVKVVPVGSWSNRYQRLFVKIPKLLVAALKSKADIYHFHDPELLLIAPFLRLSGARVIYDIHEDYVTSIQQKSYIPRPFRNLISSAMRGLEKVASVFCFQVIAERYYKEMFPRAIEILNYPIFSNRPAGYINKEPPGLMETFDDRYAWCLYTGNVTFDRGAITHLQLLKSHDQTAIAYIGKCSEEVAEAIYSTADRENIKRRRIKIIGVGEHVPRETIDHYSYTKSWLAGVALFPDTPHYTKKELTKFFEYMAAGLPILSSSFPAWKNIVEKNSCGLCVNPALTKSVTDAIDYLLSHPGEAATMGDNGRKAVEDRYNWDIEEKKLVAYYKQIVSDRESVSTS